VRQPYLLIDTAGIRKERRVHDSVEFYSVKRAEAAIARCDIAILILDAEVRYPRTGQKNRGQDHRSTQTLHPRHQQMGPVPSTVDQARRQQPAKPRRPSRQDPQPMTSLADFGRWVQKSLFFLDYAPVIFTSATTGINLDRLLEAIRYVAAQTRQRIPTALLNRTLQQAVERRQPITRDGHFLKFFYATQTQQSPPTFLLFVNRDELFSDPYKKYLAGQLRAAFGFEGCPLVLVPKPRPKSVDPIRTQRTGKSSKKRPIQRSATSKR
jgi:GTPase